jgi:hypothetical protein
MNMNHIEYRVGNVIKVVRYNQLVKATIVNIHYPSSPNNQPSFTVKLDGDNKPMTIYEYDIKGLW